MKFNARNITIGKNVKISENVKIGDNVTIYDNVEISEGTVICNDSIIGEPLNSYYHESNYINPKLKIGKRSLIRSHAIIYAGSTIGENFTTGHRVTIRENSIIGDFVSVGSYNDIQGDCTIGNYCRFHSYVNIGQKSVIGDFVFIYPYVVLTNDATPPSNNLQGVKIGNYSQITAGVVMLPGSEVGQYCLVGANSTVGGKYDDNSFISGSPAKNIGLLDKMPFFSEGKRHYPWPNNFKRGMPWEEIGYENWKLKN